MEGIEFIILKAGEGKLGYVTVPDCGYSALNEAIGAGFGTVVPCKGVTSVMGTAPKRLYKIEGVELWCDDEALMREDPKPNVLASLMCGHLIHGDALVICADVNGDTVPMPLPVKVYVRNLLVRLSDPAVCGPVFERIRAEFDSFMEETGGTGVKIVPLDGEEGGVA